jgi:hypothetical protein
MENINGLSEPADSRRPMNWHLTETSCASSVGATEMEPGVYPADYEIDFCDVVVAPGDYVDQHPEVRRYGPSDQVISRAIKDWQYSEDLVELEKRVADYLERDVYKISELDKQKIAALDRLGNISFELFSLVYKTIKQSSENKYDVETNWSELIGLIDGAELLPKQKKMFLEIVGALQADTHKLAKMFRTGLNLEVLRQTNTKEQPDSAKVDFVSLPGAVGFVFDETEYQRVYPNKSTSGFYIRAINQQGLLAGKLFVVNGGRDPEKTVRHEYVHFLNAGYIEVQGKKFDLSGGYKSEDAQGIFAQMRDELSAYAMGNEYTFDEKNLLRGGRMGFQERLAYINDRRVNSSVFFVPLTPTFCSVIPSQLFDWTQSPESGRRERDLAT